MKRGAAGLGLLAVMLTFLLVLEPLPVHAAATLVQQNKAGVSSSSSTVMVSVTLGSNVASGDVLVVGSIHDATFCSLTSVTDTLVSSFTQAVVSSGVVVPFIVHIWTATLSSHGADTVTATFACATGPSLPFDVFVYEVAGVTTAGAATAVGTGTTNSISTSTTVSFPTGAFLFAMIAGGTRLRLGLGLPSPPKTHIWGFQAVNGPTLCLLPQTFQQPSLALFLVG